MEGMVGRGAICFWMGRRVVILVVCEMGQEEGCNFRYIFG
jgi:hypothetical protein